MILSSEFRCVSRLFLFFLLSLFSIYKRRENKQRNKKKISKIQLSFGDYTSSTVGKISMKWMQQHQKKITNGDQSKLHKLSEGKGALTYLDNSCDSLRSRWWPFLMSLDLSHQYLLTVLVVFSLKFQCVSNIFFKKFFSLILSPLSYFFLL
jgi:hypothetical protein